ncbi:MULTISPECIES: ABC transporter substrate-binding protein [unclassified Janthinobacterium]|uniref:ABC transporter substrate-binding protein n=1 Tax=unclassified Janthinobacterium TaxID=2610881 RepID=UPI0003477D69|nr:MULTISPECIES: ABC transporter substrate-binding protein [unclassified Janthinobacterium]MEC5162650.1 glucose/mannose transport system substrate-binding protein [Janthinobacterium sp. CG_S6]
MKQQKLAAVVSAMAFSVATMGAARAQDKSVEVVHWWTSGGEAAALKVLKDDVVKRGFHWKDSAVAGGGGDQARTVLRARVAAGNPPDAMQMLGFTVNDYAEEGLLGNVDAVAAKEGWDKVVPAPLQKFSKQQGHWTAVPVNIHRTNWIWANKAIFDELKLTPPKTFDELVAMSGKIRKAGYIPLAHGGQSWQDATIFDSAVLSAGGPKFYKQALIDLDPKALGSKTMEKAFEQMLKLRGMVDTNFSGRDWNLATAMVYHKKAAMQIMGDWAKGEFEKGKMKANVDYLCFQYPGTEGSFLFNADQFGIFKVDAKQVAGQAVFASAVMDKSFQEKFNIVKGSIPARLDVAMDNFDDCGKKSMVDMKQALKDNTMLGSFAHGHAMPDAAKAAAVDVVTKFFNSGKSPADATKQLVAAIANSK